MFFVSYSYVTWAGGMLFSGSTAQRRITTLAVVLCKCSPYFIQVRVEKDNPPFLQQTKISLGVDKELLKLQLAVALCPGFF